MGTNFYIDMVPGTHIGKRSAAGIYCWNCGITLRKGGISQIHNSTIGSRDWYDACPSCGAKYEKESLESSAAGKELGFSSIRGKQTGVKSCCSFTWAINPSKLETIEFIVDEYGNSYSLEEFKKELEYCPIQYTDNIGQDFS